MTAGFYGKMPCKGDFVGRGLPRTLLDALDSWFQQGLVQSRQQLGEHWLEYYRVSPVWYFYLAAGVVAEQAWVGVFIPSVDKVGRHFPCWIMLPLDRELADLEAFTAQYPGLDRAAELLLDSLENGFDFDQFCQQVAQLQAVTRVPESDSDSGSAAGRSLPIMGNCYRTRGRWARTPLESQVAAPCVWASEGSEILEPQLRVTDGLPDPALFGQFLTGEGCGHSSEADR
ncbi:MAG: type VI secretion system protein ImpM [Motiliproteus sp.]|jgi:type VI secretion system protein ImpM